MLSSSLLQRLGWASAVLLVLWACVAWALA